VASRLERLAGVLVDYSTRIRKGDLVCIDTGPAARPLVQEVWKRVLDAGAHPHLRLDVDGASDLLVEAFGDAGRHARSAVGMQQLHYGMAIEIEGVFEIR